MTQLDRQLRQRHPHLNFTPWDGKLYKEGGGGRRSHGKDGGEEGRKKRVGVTGEMTEKDKDCSRLLRLEDQAMRLDEQRRGVGHSRFASQGAAMPEKPFSGTPAARIAIKVCQANGLAAKDSGGTSDPYCEIFADGRAWRTSTKVRQLHPRWDEEVVVEVSSINSLLHLVLFDWNRIADHVFMGEVLVPVCELPCSGETVDEWYELQQPRSIAQGVSGKLQLQLQVSSYDKSWITKSRDKKRPTIPEMPLAVASTLTEQRSGKQHGLIGGEDASVRLGTSSRPGTLKLRVVEAIDLVAMDSPRGENRSGTSDPFVEIFLEDSYWRTSTVKKTCNPSWSDSAQHLPVSSLESLLHLVLFDHDVLSSNDYLGEVVMTLEHLQRGELLDQWYKVQAPPSHEAPITGYVRLEMQLTGLKDAARGGSFSSFSEVQSPVGSTLPAELSASRSELRHERKPSIKEVHREASRMAASSLGSSREMDRRMAANRERPLSERTVRVFGEGAPTRRDIKSVRPQDQAATLELRILSGVGLASRDSNGVSDPYCEAFVWCPDDPACSHVWRTATKLKTLNPKWDESETVHLTSRDAMLHLVAFDWDKVGSDDFLGEVPVNLSNYDNGRWHSLQLHLLQLDPASGKEPVTGFLEVELRFTIHKTKDNE